jgi:starvation-inducible DNA-binding protein
MAAANSRLPEYPTSAVDGLEHLKALVERVGAYANHLRSAIDETASAGDASTSDLFTEISRTVDKRLWFLEAHLQGR